MFNLLCKIPRQMDFQDLHKMHNKLILKYLMVELSVKKSFDYIITDQLILLKNKAFNSTSQTTIQS